MKFKQVNWKSAYKWLEQKQSSLLEAYEKNNIGMVRHIQISILKDYRTAAIAVRRVTTNPGKRTPGTDGSLLFT
jgi:RNA-directed DNA polymerase